MARHSVVAMGALLATAGCTSMRPVQPVTFFANHSPELVWVTDTNRTVMALSYPWVASDSLRGMRPGTQDSVTIPLAQVRRVEAKTSDQKRTAILASALGVGAVSFVYFMWVVRGAGAAGPDCSGDEVAKHPDQHPECPYQSPS